MLKTATHLVWIDLETDNLPSSANGVWDFTNVHLMEFAMIITDVGLNIHPLGGYTEIVKMNPETAATLRSNESVRKMHVSNGLIADCIKATKTMEDIDQEVSEILAESGISPGVFAIAGSGVAMFDLPFIKAKMPKLATWLAYYPYDFGVFRRLLTALAGQYVINPQLESYSDEAKLHRAMNDVTAHLREAQAYRTWVREIPAVQELWSREPA